MTKITLSEDQILRNGINEIADQLCKSVDGVFDFKIETDNANLDIQKLSMLINFLLDQYDRKTSQLEESEEFIHAILDSLSSHIAIINETGTIIHVNQAWKTFADNNFIVDAGSEFDYFQGVNYLELCKKVAESNQNESSDALAVFCGIQDVLSKNIVEYYYQYPCHSPHEERWFNLRVTRLNQLNVNHVVVAHENITEQKRIEKLLYQSQKMEALGQLASGIAHDFNNFHWIIKTNTKLLMSEMEPDSEPYEDAKEIIEVTKRASELTKELITLSKKQELKPTKLNLNEAVNQMQTIFKRFLNDKISITMNLDLKVGSIHIDPDQLEQVILNIVINACDAMPSGGNLTIETSSVVVNNKSHNSVDSSKYMKLTIRDAGCGMDQETQSKIFNPFFTTKDAGKGTGLGLSTVYGIVEQNGGIIEVETELMKGTAFHLYFPEFTSTE